MSKKPEPTVERYLACSDLCQLLSLFLRLPDTRMADGLRDGTLKADVAAILGELGLPDEQAAPILEDLDEYFGDNRPTEELLSALRREYTRLFSHPKNPAVQIYEALYRWDPESDEPRPSLFVSPAALDAERCYKKAGLARSQEVNESGDHFATQLEFLMYLYAQLAMALREGQAARKAELDAILAEFSELHLQRWAVGFFTACIEAGKDKTMTAFWQVGKVFFSELW